MLTISTVEQTIEKVLNRNINHYGGSVHIDTDLCIYLPTPPVFFMSLGYPLSPFCFYFAHNSYG